MNEKEQEKHKIAADHLDYLKDGNKTLRDIKDVCS